MIGGAAAGDGNLIYKTAFVAFGVMNLWAMIGLAATDSELLNAVLALWPVFMSMVISYALLFTYWRAHHFIASVYAKNITVELANINGLFFLLITLVPFAARFLGEEDRVAVYQLARPGHTINVKNQDGDVEFSG